MRTSEALWRFSEGYGASVGRASAVAPSVFRTTADLESARLLRTGNYVDGKEEGHWIEAPFAPSVLTMEGVYTDGLRNGE